MKKINKNIDIIALILIFLLFLVSICTKNHGNTDEIWNYNFARNLANGLLPYKDFSIIVPHIIYEIPALFMRIFSTELMIFRIFTTILGTSVFYMIYKILKLLKINEVLSLIVALGLGMINLQVYYYEYNRFLILIALILLYIELKHIDKNKLLSYSFKHNAVIGLLLGLSILIKHTVGAVMLIGIIGYKLLVISNKEELIIYIKTAFTRLAFAFIPIIIFIGYLLKNNILTDFLDYVIYGVLTFTNKLPFNQMIIEQDLIMMKLVAGIIVYIVPLTIIYLFLSGLKRKNRSISNDKKIIIFAYSITTYALFFPLTDFNHIISAGLIAIIGLIYSIKELITRKEIKIICNYNALLIVIFITVIPLLTIKTINYINDEDKSNIDNFNNIVIEKQNQETITLITNYIKENEKLGYDVYMLDFRAATYMIVLNRYNKDYDMYNIGNLGADGETGEINRIKESSNTLYLILNEKYYEELKSAQNPEKTRNYIRSNLKYIDDIDIYSVYYKK